MQETAIAKKIKRRRFSQTERKDYIDSWKKSGLSMVQFSRNQGLPVSSFAKWVRSGSGECESAP